MAEVTLTSNLDFVIKELNNQVKVAAEIIGGMAESYAKKLCPVDTGNLRNSITHTTEDNGATIVIGTAVTYAPYVELGTGVHAEEGKGRKTPWSYKDADGKWHTTSGMKPQPFLRPAFENHKDEYKRVLKETLEG